MKQISMATKLIQNNRKIPSSYTHLGWRGDVVSALTSVWILHVWDILPVQASGPRPKTNPIMDFFSKCNKNEGSLITCRSDTSYASLTIWSKPISQRPSPFYFKVVKLLKEIQHLQLRNASAKGCATMHCENSLISPERKKQTLKVLLLRLCAIFTSRLKWVWHGALRTV